MMPGNSSSPRLSMRMKVVVDFLLDGFRNPAAGPQFGQRGRFGRCGHSNVGTWVVSSSLPKKPAHFGRRHSAVVPRKRANYRIIAQAARRQATDRRTPPPGPRAMPRRWSAETPVQGPASSSAYARRRGSRRPARVDMALQVSWLIISSINRTLPSPNSTLQPPGCSLNISST